MRHQSIERATSTHQENVLTVAFLVSHGIMEDESRTTWEEGQGTGGGHNLCDLVSFTDQQEATSNNRGLHRRTVQHRTERLQTIDTNSYDEIP